MMSTEAQPLHRSGFVHILGKPNAGKSTLFNVLVQAPLSIVTPKVQTTRRQLIGISSGVDFQAVYVDTPGYIKPTYALQASMMRSVRRAMVDGDVLLWVVDVRDKVPDGFLLSNFKLHLGRCFLLVNKVDLVDTATLNAALAMWKSCLKAVEVLPISARYQSGLTDLVRRITQALPVHPAYYDKDDITDQPVRFFAAEMVRKALFLRYHKEVPYSTQVMIDAFKEGEKMVWVEATIYVARLSQKKILIGKGGRALKGVGIAARQDLVAFLGKKVFLGLHVKVLADWCKKPKVLRQWGYA